MTTERITRCFSGLAGKRPALITYLCVGDPRIEETVSLARACVDGGADMLELGVPFSDPTADGPVIAAASHRAIRHGGSLRAALSVVKQLRGEGVDVPVVLFGYYNPIVAFGESELPAAAAEAGADALLVVDLPPDEGAHLRASAKRHEISVIPLIAPTSGPEREPEVVRGASGFVYYVSVTGVTGTGEAPLAEASRAARALSQRVGLPVAVGFGIDSKEKARVVAEGGADGVIVGTALVKLIAEAPSPEARVHAVTACVQELRSALG